MKRLLLLLFVFTSVAYGNTLEDWGATGHRVTGEIAQQHLSRKAEKAINRLLRGESLAFASTYGDEIKSDPAYRSFGPWHYVNFPFDSTYESHNKSDKGDLIRGIDTCIAKLKSKTSTDEEKVFHLKMLIHFIGDLHQPMHVGMAKDKGGNDVQVRWFNDGSNLHRVWDTNMIEDYSMSYQELADNAAVLSKAQLAEIKKGSTIDWMYESRAICKEIYQSVKPGDKLSYQYRYKYFPVVRSQLQKGGIRLAVLLNDIFS